LRRLESAPEQSGEADGHSRQGGRKEGRPEGDQFSWEGKNKAGKVVRGEIRAASESVANAALRRQGINVTKLKKQKPASSGKVSDKDITLFSRQLATMVKSGVPLLQSFDIVGKGTNNPALAKLLFDIKADVETGSNLATAFRKYPMYFDALFCNLVEAGEQAGILDSLLDRLATYKEKIQAIKAKIKGALFYPVAILVVAFVITAVIMIFVVPAFKGVFASFGGELPAPTMVVIAISDGFWPTGTSSLVAFTRPSTALSRLSSARGPYRSPSTNIP
jgi:type IV pilus assembly protein PilC